MMKKTLFNFQPFQYKTFFLPMDGRSQVFGFCIEMHRVEKFAFLFCSCFQANRNQIKINDFLTFDAKMFLLLRNRFLKSVHGELKFILYKLNCQTILDNILSVNNRTQFEFSRQK